MLCCVMLICIICCFACPLNVICVDAHDDMIWSELSWAKCRHEWEGMRWETLRSSRTSILRRGEAVASTIMHFLERSGRWENPMSPRSAFYNLPWRVWRGCVSSGNKLGSKLPRQLTQQQAASHYPSASLWGAGKPNSLLVVTKYLSPLAITNCYDLSIVITNYN